MAAAIVCGNPIDGLELIGPFDDFEAATEYAEREIDDDWWVTELYLPVARDA